MDINIQNPIFGVCNGMCLFFHKMIDNKKIAMVVME
jgi:hypothetical protein